MVEDLAVWRDFPKGLRILLLDQDRSSASETRLKLEAMDYIVTSYYDEKDALEAISKKAESFHVAIVEVTTGNSHGSFRFLEMAKDLPTIVISNVCCLSTMMKCIALGAAEFLQKPLSEDKLRNIWQHVVHKALNAGGKVLYKSLKPIKETVVSMLRLQSYEAENEKKDQENDRENSVTNERFSAPSTPQLIQGGRLLDDGDFQEQPNCSKSVDNTCNYLNGVGEKQRVSTCKAEEAVAEEEDPKKKKPPISVDSHSHGNRGERKRMKVYWTPELHRRFVQVIEKLGIDQAIPSKILELMKVEGLTRHNIASHLQKFRMHRRHILPKDDNMRWQMQRDFLPRGSMLKPPLAFPPYHFNYGLQPNQVYHVWGHPTYLPSGVQMWSHAPWHPPPQSLLWNTYAGVPYSQCSFASPPPPMSNGLDAVRYRDSLLKDSYDLNPAEEVIDEVVKEALSKPLLPLPLGLKPPSTDSVLAELHRQGIRTIAGPRSSNPPPRCR